MIDKIEIDALERIRAAVADGISNLIRIMILLGLFLGVWGGLLVALVYWLTGGRFPPL